MKIVFKIALGAFGFVVIAFLISMALGAITDSLPSVEATDNLTDNIINSIKDNFGEWKIKFEISGLATLICVITGLLPIPRNFKIPALLLEFLGGAIAWLLTSL